MKNSKKVAVIGAGASGMMAAIQASRAGCAVTVFEKQKKPGRKLGITGNGQCNISNTGIDLSRYHGHNPHFVRNIFARYSPEDTKDFFESIGIPFIEKKSGKLYPHCLQAQAVTDILEYEMKHCGAELAVHRRIDEIHAAKNGVTLIGPDQERLVFDAVILAAGSCAYPQLGAEMPVYDIARRAGHHIYEPFPAVLPITIPLKALHRLEGIKWDCGMRAVQGGRNLSASQGEVLFTKYGLSGPASLEISRGLNESILKGGSPHIEMDFFPAMQVSALSDLADMLFAHEDRTVSFALQGVLKKKMPEVLLQIIGVDPEKKCSALSQKERSLIVRSLKSFVLQPGTPRTFSEAVVAAGGIDVNEIHPSTMESKKIKNLHIVGEILDIDGDSGGFNLQFAWSTGAIAGIAQG